MTASKAIIEKEYQPHVIVSTAGPNPFTALTDRELEEYRREVERKQRGPGGGCARPAGPAWRRLCAWWRLRGAGNRPPQDRRAWAGSGLDVTQHVPPPHSFRPVPKHIKHAARALVRRDPPVHVSETLGAPRDRCRAVCVCHRRGGAAPLWPECRCQNEAGPEPSRRRGREGAEESEVAPMALPSGAPGCGGRCASFWLDRRPL